MKDVLKKPLKQNFYRLINWEDDESVYSQNSVLAVYKFIEVLHLQNFNISPD